MRLVKSLGFALALTLTVAVVAGRAQTLCLQDQYGNQYNFTVDRTQTYVYGTTIGAGCGAVEWPITGSFVQQDGIILELTASNPLGVSDNCVLTYKLKGKYPYAAWYYEDGYGGQEFTWADCAPTTTLESQSGQGRLK
ncbi:MAG: hypothetical protein HY900_25630 [Deltaproteobacteria bacterium]|nr:hypothetical protein [Deltaproteobacteria bacterium]